jgi:Family of unknown function (DUF6476)
MSDTGGMRALKVVTIVMAVLIVLGTVTLLVLLARRSAAPSPAPAAVAAGPGFSATLAEPEGTRIVGVSEGGDRLAVHLQGGGPDRVVLVDPRTGAVVGRVGLAH